MSVVYTEDKSINKTLWNFYVNRSSRSWKIVGIVSKSTVSRKTRFKEDYCAQTDISPETINFFIKISCTDIFEWLSFENIK